MKEIIIISGRSGAGKTTASHALEDMGYFVVDNLPPQLLDDLLSIATTSKKPIEKIALIIDVRETEFLELLPKKWSELDEKKYKKKLIFLDASDNQLIDRFQETKRRHPLDDGCGVRVALQIEEKRLLPIKLIANKTIMTNSINAHMLKNLLKTEIHGSVDFKKLNVILMSFGYKHGLPSELDLCFDVRFLANPFYVETLRSKSGLDVEVMSYINSSPTVRPFLEKVATLIDFLYPLYCEEGKANLTIAFGCTGGQHRSVSVAEMIKTMLTNKIEQIRVEHRDLSRHN